MSLNIFLAPEMGQSIALHVAVGRYGIASEVMRAALHLPERPEPRKDAPAQRGRDVGTPHNPERT